jgi:hypothetical protein
MGMKWPNRAANRLLTRAANLMFDARITDEATAYKAFRTHVLRGIRLTSMRFEFCPEVTAKLRRLGYRIREVPIHYNARSVQQGKKIRYRDGVEALWTLLKYRLAPLGSFAEDSSPVKDVPRISGAGAAAPRQDSAAPGRSRAAG